MAKKIFFCILISIILVQLTLIKNVFAYLDPGTGSYVFQVLVAAVIGGLFAIKTFWYKIKNIFVKRFYKKSTQLDRE